MSGISLIFWWFVEFFWFGLAIYGLPLTLIGTLLSTDKSYRDWLGGKKGYIKTLSKLPGTDLKDAKNIKYATLFYLGGSSLVLLILMSQQYQITVGNLGFYLIKGAIGIFVLYGLLIERWELIFGSEKIINIEDLLAMSPAEFEHLVAGVFRRLGYNAQLTGKSGDGGVDIEIHGHSKMGIVQCKRYNGLVGIGAIRELYGTMIHFGVDEAYLVTSGHFSTGSSAFIKGKPIKLVDGHALYKMLN